MKIFKEFKEFALKGNTLNLAVGVIIGGALQGIIKSLVANVFLPLVGMFVKIDFKSAVFVYNGSEMRYGEVITEFINFVIMLFIIFAIVKFAGKVTEIAIKNKDDEEPVNKECPYCLGEIPYRATRCSFCTSELEYTPFEENDETSEAKS